MLPRLFQTRRAFPRGAASTVTPSKSRRTWARHHADLNPRGAISVALVVVVGLLGACATAPPTRRDVVVGLVGEPLTVFDDDPSARFIASAVTETRTTSSSRDSPRPFQPWRTAACASLPTMRTHPTVDLSPGSTCATRSGR